MRSSQDDDKGRLPRERRARKAGRARADSTDQRLKDLLAAILSVCDGDFSVRLPVRKRTGERDGILIHIAEAFNHLVERNDALAREVSRLATRIGQEGEVGERASMPDARGAWASTTGAMNSLIESLVWPTTEVARVITAVAAGDLSQQMDMRLDGRSARGEFLRIGNTVNRFVEQLRAVSSEVTRVAREVGFEGKLGAQTEVRDLSGTWRDLTDSVNMLAGNLTNQVRNIAVVTTAVANGDLSQKITVEARGEILELKETINTMVDQLRAFAAEVTRVAREVGTEGKLGGQAAVPGVAGTWKDLTDNVNQMASNLTSQVRGIVQVVTAVATGDLTKKLVVAAKGEIAALADTANAMTDTLRTFAEQVTTVAREVGIEGKLGGQAKVPGAAGTWRDLVDNVNQLAGNLTTQVRAISEVASAVTAGDLTRTIDVEAQGEVLSLKDTINQMIANLRDTTQTNKEQDWLKTNLAKFSGMMQGQRSLESLAQLIMSELTPVASAQLGTFFVADSESEKETSLSLLSSYGYTRRKHLSNRFSLGDGLVGQAALEKKPILVRNVPPDYVAISSSLGEASPRNLVVLPILFEGRVRGVIELGSFEEFSPIHITFLEQLALSIGVVMNMISASRRTEELLEELRRSNAELERRSSELEEKASLLEVRNREIAEASANLEEKAKQLALVSKYKSEFLANMSHELRTPLNSIMILASLLGENSEGNLTQQQTEYARTIHSSGKDLLALITQILDLSKIEAGKMDIERRRVPLGEIRAYVEQHFAPIAQQKNLRFAVSIAPDAPATITTDAQRLQQILKNLLSNAFKFTESGSVDLRMGLERSPQRFQSQALRRAPAALAFSIADTGIGIPKSKQQIIFEAFQQVDASTARVYGGTGLGLTISRELARLLGGEIHLRSSPGAGSTFALYLPLAPEDRRESVKADELGGYEQAHTVEPAEERPAIVDLPDPDAEAPPALVPGPALEATEGAQGDLSGKSVLVVDDDVRNLFAVTSLLERYGARVIPAGSAREAFDALDQGAPVDLVLMDMMMPEVDGYTATRELRKHPRYGRLPVVALTAKAMPGDREKVLEAGCDDFVAKPVERERLIAVLKQWLPAARPA